MFKLFRGGRKARPARSCVPDGVRAYVVGDVHGRSDLLSRLLPRIAADAAGADATRRIAVFLGDYVDRGLDSRGVIETLSGNPLPDFESIHLKGNHEAALIDFLRTPSRGREWLGFGGVATLASYGIHLGAAPSQERLADAAERLAAAMPDHHRRFLDGLALHAALGDYLCVHAGIRPGVPLDRQQERDLLWIRDEFLDSDADHGRVVVHGHSVSPEPEIRPNRIGIDTGAFATGRLTCLVLEGEARRFLPT
jgi:serine/threonine protein phosphatase 1